MQETSTDTLEYYVATIVWRPFPNKDAPTAKTRIMPVDVAMPRETPRLGRMGCVSLLELEQANIPPGLAASDVKAQLSAWRIERNHRRQERQAQLVAERERRERTRTAEDSE